MRIAIPLTVLTAALACSLGTAPANARARVFVASYGSDSNPCTFLSPCRNFQQAVNVVDPGGEVTAIDSAGFGSLTITKAVTITSPNGIEAGVAASATAPAITINAGPSDIVTLQGLTLDGAGSSGDGVVFNSGSSLQVLNCSIRNFLFNGIYVGVGASSSTSLLVSNTFITNISSVINSSGIYVYNGSTVTVDHVTLSNDSVGISLYAVGAPTQAMVSDSEISTGVYGLVTQGLSSEFSVSVALKNVKLNSYFTGIKLAGYTTAYLSQVTEMTPIVAGNFGITASGAGNSILSDGTNHFTDIGFLTLGTWTSQ